MLVARNVLYVEIALYIYIARLSYYHAALLEIHDASIRSFEPIQALTELRTLLPYVESGHALAIY